jgi:CRP/FNR family transcriptional regulator
MRDAVALLDQMFPDDESVSRLLGDSALLKRIPAGEVVFRPGDACEYYLVVVSGTVCVKVLSSGGREMTLYRVNDNQSCVITTSCLIGHDVYPAEGVTESETEVLVIPRARFDEVLDESAAFRRFVFSGQGQRLSSLIQRFEEFAFGRLDARLARFLDERSEGGARPVLVTHQEIASELGTAREVVTRQLKSLEAGGCIATGRGRIEILDAAALAEAANRDE